jgi:hypothetical protein
MEEVDVILSLEKSENEQAWRRAAADKLGIHAERIGEIRLCKHSIDARQRQIKVQLRLKVSIDGNLPEESIPDLNFPGLGSGSQSVLIIGCGPAGMFAALRCLELGNKPIILERGKDVSTRRFDLAPLLRKGIVDENSNYCFGEGGAGTFSDGKLYTRAKKRGSVAKVYQVLVSHGAPKRILIDAHPHIGSNLLPNVVKAMRNTILAAGGEVHFGTRVTDLLINEGRIFGVSTSSGNEFKAEAVILATGHSARDMYQILRQRQVLLKQKSFAMGVRIEHPQSLIDRLQYHLKIDQPRPELLPAASYRLATEIDERGVHSFCMCPGGFIVPAATANDEIVINGMSLARRDSPFANSGLVVTVNPEDTLPYQREHGQLAGLAFQRFLETSAKAAGEGGQTAPAQRVIDFLKSKESSRLPATSYFPGIIPARLDMLMPKWMVKPMQAGLKYFEYKLKGYTSQDAILVGFETRTSSPVRIPRDDRTLQHPEIKGLYPCGEGAGYAGGIVSAALDGIRCAEASTSVSD